MSDAPTLMVRIRIVFLAGGQLPPVERVLTPATTLRELLASLAREDALPPGAGWTFRARDGAVLQLTETIRELAYRQGAGTLELILVPTSAPVPSHGETAPPAPAAPPAAWPAPAAPAPRRRESDDSDRDGSDEETEAADASVYRTERGSAPTAAPADERRRKFKKSRRGMKGLTDRRATVRYYSRMNPDRMFPLLVILSAQQVQEIAKAKVKQAVSESFRVEAGAPVEVEPVLPGCDCYPPRHTLTVESADAVTEAFWIVPRVLGRVHGARVLIRQGGRVLADVPLDVKVSRQTLAVACGLMSLAAPYLSMGLKSLKLDYEPQKADGFPLYQRAGSWVAENVRPEWLGLGFLGLAFVLYLWMRPRRRDTFWDVNVK
ncbi:hypothetical protein [Frigoriglobus tundricola]|uniref:Uncharacterized protein n=1 Tax=Frigoriglobus tundricola TaxID=2774151 RepID=A0A6M5YU52_9BACT|nr:hypothetical protein [Frigoriglobus tundricola]QJW96890.1 hypothetical protein FTUN_4450 [Frigoriglobus tundricola]